MRLMKDEKEIPKQQPISVLTKRVHEPSILELLVVPSTSSSSSSTCHIVC